MRKASSRAGSAADPAARRDVLRLCAGASLGWATGGVTRAHGEAADDTNLDEALRLLHGHEPESRQGLSTHAPMVAEALCSLGRPEEAVRWVEGYRAPLLPIPRPTGRIDPERWKDFVGARPGAGSWEESLERWADWREFFLEAMQAAPWPQVLDLWAGRLAPGLCAAATHGVIRTAHAARALSRRDTKERRGELARGLAYWASAYQELPARQFGGARATGYAQALEEVPSFWERSGRVPTGNIVSGLRQAGELPGFADALERVAPRADVAEALSELTATAARLYLRHGTQGRSVATIAFIHGVTGPCALRRLLPQLRPETAQAALPFAWQAVAGIYAAYARRENAAWRDDAPAMLPAELATRAVANGDEHAIKFTEALLGEHALRPDSAYLAAARDVVSRL